MERHEDSGFHGSKVRPVGSGISRTCSMTDSKTSITIAPVELDLEVLEGLGPEEREVVVGAMREAYERGVEDSEKRNAKFVARCFGILMGVPIGEDRPDRRVRERISRLASILRSNR